MNYKIRANIVQSGNRTLRAWYAGRSATGPLFEMEVTDKKVLSYQHLENAQDDKTYLERMSDLCTDVEIVTFSDEGQIIDDTAEETSHAATVELEELSALEILADVQEILTRMITPGIHAQTNQTIAHEQVRTALGLVLRAISILRKSDSQSGDPG